MADWQKDRMLTNYCSQADELLDAIAFADDIDQALSDAEELRRVAGNIETQVKSLRNAATV